MNATMMILLTIGEGVFNLLILSIGWFIVRYMNKTDKKIDILFVKIEALTLLFTTQDKAISNYEIRIRNLEEVSRINGTKIESIASRLDKCRHCTNDNNRDDNK
jgi:hypothetical protein